MLETTTTLAGYEMLGGVGLDVCCLHISGLH